MMRCKLESTGREPVAASIPRGRRSGHRLWTGSGGTGVVAVVHNSETGNMRPSGSLLLVAVSLSLAIAAPAAPDRTTAGPCAWLSEKRLPRLILQNPTGPGTRCCPAFRAWSLTLW
jgi:hypothetical protein